MNELRRDPITGRWNIVFLENPADLSDLRAEPHRQITGLGVPTAQPHAKNPENCPFCYGMESNVPHEIIAHRKYGPANTPGWTVRVVPNKYPALRIEGDLNKEGIGLFDIMNGVGAHEVIIETPDHFRDMADMDYVEMEEVIWAYLARSVDLRRDKRFKYILIFKNYGTSAGASLEHAHSQLIALPIVPKVVAEELDGAAKYYDYKERCVFCDMIRQERYDKDRIVYDGKDFMAFCPYVSRCPYEIWILPKKHQSDFGDLQRDSVPDLAKALRDCLARIKGLLSDPAYNFIIHSAPINGHERADYHWHIEIIPKLAKIAGFEWGSGFYINPVPPELAAKNLMSVKLVEK
jgi:UDPglucose--hexose-1-phosphate uridylyltransferase